MAFWNFDGGQALVAANDDAEFVRCRPLSLVSLRCLWMTVTQIAR